jgi:hypothetical protein
VRTVGANESLVVVVPTDAVEGRRWLVEERASEFCGVITDAATLHLYFFS